MKIIEQEQAERAENTTPVSKRTCVHCGCTEDRACRGGCSWAVMHRATDTGVCSRCVMELEALAYFAPKIEQEQAEGAEPSPLSPLPPVKTNGERAVLTRAEAADFLRCSLRQLAYWQKKRLIPFSKIGHCVWFARADLLQWLKEHRHEARAA